MFKKPSRTYSRCFISAPVGIDLGVLPQLLGERKIAWNWASNDFPVDGRFTIGIQKCDFAIGILDGSRYDFNVIYEVGVAEGLGKPVLLIALNKNIRVPTLSSVMI